ncbi:unnamed protein product [Schistosoma margrebowiei]|uniref:Uncharacterized protein n=1 Tax=Schistosoma margrebowiei TaxID=48269 RepID=A0AA85AHQ4_9TREM|nr:unnamed protein product [Schistosoma margrebowiei]
MLGVIQASQYENTFSEIYSYQKKMGLSIVLEEYKATLKMDEEKLRNVTKQIGMLTNEINQKLSRKSLSINQYVDCMGKVLEGDNSVKQTQGIIGLINLVKSQRTYINQYNTDLLAHQYLLEIINEI